MPWTGGFELPGKGVWTTQATSGCLWVGKRVCMSMEVYIYVRRQLGENRANNCIQLKAM